MPYLSLILFLPLAAAVAIMLFPKDSSRWLAGLTSLVVLGLSIAAFLAFDRSVSGMQLVEKAPWIPQYGVSYFVGVDGISLPMVILTGLLVFMAVLVSWRLDVRPKEYFALMMILETAMMGVFVS